VFEYKLQKSWDNYQRDFGLGRIGLFVSLFCFFLFLFTLIFYSQARYSFLLPVVLVYVLSFFNGIISKQKKVIRFAISCLFLASVVPYLYHQTGVVDSASDGLGRYDALFALLDQRIFGAPIANLIQNAMGESVFATLFYDWIQTAYLFYFVFPFYGAIVYYRRLPDHEKYKVARLTSSVAIYFSLNFFFYIAVPVTGPQFFMPSVFTSPLPLSAYGQFLNSLVSNGQPSFIDCFPSGHVGISLLVTVWFYKMNSRHFYFSLLMLISIFCATLALRYHYLLDVICSVSLVVFCYSVSRVIIPQGVYRRKR
jgi:hypothetical protein